MSAAFGLMLALAVGAPAGPINFNLPPPALPQPRPAWSNLQLRVPKPPSRPAWLPPWVFPDLSRPVYQMRHGTGPAVNPYLGGDRSHGGGRGSYGGVHP